MSLANEEYAERQLPVRTFSVDVDEIADVSRDFEKKAKVKSAKSRVSLNMLMKIMILRQNFREERKIPHTDSKGDRRGKSAKKKGAPKNEGESEYVDENKGQFFSNRVSLNMLMKTIELSFLSDYIIEKEQLTCSTGHQFCDIGLFPVRE